MRFWVDIKTAAGAMLGAGPIYNAGRVTVRKRLSRAGDWSFDVPAGAERTDLIQPRRYAWIYGMVEGVKTHLGGGPIEKIGTRIGTDGFAVLTVSGGDLLRELARITAGELTLDGTGNANVDELLDLTGDSPLSWSYTRTGNSPLFKARLVHESLLNAILTVAEKTGAMFRQEESGGDPRHIAWFYTNASSGLLATMHGDPVAMESNPNVCLITGIQQAVEDAYDMKTRAYVFGSGEGASQITLSNAEFWPDGVTGILANYVIDGQTYFYDAVAPAHIVNQTAEAAYGREDVAVRWRDIGPITNSGTDMIAAGNFLVTATVEFLHARRLPYVSYALSVAGLRSTLEPGQTIRVQARRYRDGEKPIDIDETLYVLEVQNSIDTEGVRTTGLTVSNLVRWPMTAAEELVRELESSKITGLHPQTGPNVDTVTYREHVDDTHEAALHFWLGEETATVQSVVARIRVDPLRSTAKSAGSSSTTSSAGSSHSHTVPDHQHDITIIGQATPLTYNIGYGAGGTSGGVRHDIGATDHTFPTDSGSGGTTSANESSHTHTMTPTITLTYGVFDESSGNTYAATSIDYKVNSGSWITIIAGDAVSGASGWYQIDITSSVYVAATQRPQAAANTLYFRVTPAAYATKTAQLTVQIERRTSVQSIKTY